MASVAVELALVLPLLIMLLSGLFDLGFAAYEAMEVQAAAAAGAQYAMLNPTTWTAAQIAAIVQGTNNGSSSIGAVAADPPPTWFCACPTAGSLNVPVNCSAACPDGTSPSYYVEVSAKLAHLSLWPFSILAPGTMLRGRAIVRFK